jgi:tetratricopeptide (TPR) repeat protein
MRPLGLNLDFLFGHGYLSARDRRLGDWATLDTLRMEIPDLSFPFDARGGVGRFRNTRCHVREIRMTISESGLLSSLARALDEIEGFYDLQLRFGDGVAHAVVRLTSMGSDTWITFKLGAMRPEPARGDIIHVLVHDVRAYGPVPYPARLLVSELVARLLGSEALARPGRGRAFDVAHRGDLIELRPLKLGLLSLFPTAGWKMPDLSAVRLESVRIQPGALTIAARTALSQQDALSARDTLGETGMGRGAAEALGAYEARDLCKSADEALWSGELEAAVGALQGLREIYGAHRSVTSRLLDALLASPGAAFVVEARVLVEELLRADPDDVCALTAAPTIHLMRGERAEAAAAYEVLARVLRARGETADLITCLLASAAVQRRTSPAASVAVLQEVLAQAPRDRRALEMLRDLYYELDRSEELTDVLRRLSTLVTERESLIEIYQELAHLLMHRRHDLVEARLYLEKVLSLDVERVDALVSMGDSYALDAQPLRALKVFGSAARAAAQRGDDHQAARLHLRIGQLWAGPLDEPQSALVSVRRALVHEPGHRQAMRLGIELALAQNQPDGALGFVEQLVPLVEADLDAAETKEDRREALGQARSIHLRAAEVAVARGREDAAASHHRRSLAFRRHADAAPEPGGCPSFDFLDAYLRRSGRPEDLLDLYRTELDSEALEPERRCEMHERLAVVFDEVLRVASEAISHLRLALELDPARETALAHLARLLERDRRFEELRDALMELDARIQDRVSRAAVLLRLGVVQTQRLEDPTAGAITLRRAMSLRPAEAAIAAALVEAERDALRGSGDDPRPLLAALERLGEVAQDVDTRHAAWLEAGDLCADRLERAERAEGFYRRAASLRDDPRVEERLRRVARPSTPAPAPDTPPLPASVVSASEVSALDPASLDGPQMGRLPRTDESVAGLAQEIGNNLADAIGDLDGFRQRLASVQVESASLAESRAVLSRLGKPRPGTQISIPAPAGSAETAPDQAGDAPASPAQALDPIADTSAEGAPDQARERPSTPALEQAAGRAVESPDTAPSDATRPVASLNREVFSTLHRARQSGDPEALRDALENALFLPSLAAEDRAAFCADLGQLYYYDLESTAVARERLEEAIALDPEGAGGNLDVLTALEGVYEDLDEPNGLADVYGRRLVHADSDEMRKVYGLLLAEVLEERLEEPAKAEDALRGVLELEPDNAPAAQGVARLAEARGDSGAALSTLRLLARSMDPKDITRWDVLRQFAAVLERHAARAEMDLGVTPSATDAREEAVALWQQVLADSAVDTTAIGALKSLLPQLGRYDDAVAVLGRELGLLVGQPGAYEDTFDPALLSIDELAEPIRYPVSQILYDAAALSERAQKPEDAMAFYQRARDIWPENIDALTDRISLARRMMEDGEDTVREGLAADLESMAGFLLDEGQQASLRSEADALRTASPSDIMTVKVASLSRPGDLLSSEDASSWPGEDFPMSSGERPARSPAVDVPPARVKGFGNDSNPFGLPALEPESKVLDSTDATPVLDPNYSFALEDHLEGDPDAERVDSASALDRAGHAEREGDRDGLIEWLGQALRGLDPSQPTYAMLRRQILVRKACAHMGTIGTVGVFDPNVSDLNEALALVDAALAIDEVDEPDAHFVRVDVLAAMGRTDEAVDCLVSLARSLEEAPTQNLGEGTKFGDDTEFGLERKIVAGALAVLTAGRAVDRRDHVLYRLCAANDRVRIAIERDKLL